MLNMCYICTHLLFPFLFFRVFSLSHFCSFVPLPLHKFPSFLPSFLYLSFSLVLHFFIFLSSLPPPSSKPPQPSPRHLLLSFSCSFSYTVLVLARLFDSFYSTTLFSFLYLPYSFPLPPLSPLPPFFFFPLSLNLLLFLLSLLTSVNFTLSFPTPSS